MAQTKSATSEPKTADASPVSKQTQEAADASASNVNAPKEPTTDSASMEDPAVAAKKNYDNAVVLYAAGKYEEAIAALKEANKFRTDDPESHYLLGMAYMQSKAYKDAADSFRRALRYKPDWAEANFRFGMMSYVLGRRSQSTEAYKKLLELDSPLANALYRVMQADLDPAGVAETVVAESDSAVANASRAAASQPDTKPTEERVSAPAASVTPSTESPASAPANTDATTVTPDALALTTTYKIGVGDVLDVRLLNTRSNRSSLYTVLDDGVIDFPIAGGAIAVAGLSTEEVQLRISEELKRRAVESQAQVSVGVRQYASHKVVVSGLVSNAGTKVLRREAVPLYVVLAEVQPRLDAARAVVMRTGKAHTFELSDPASLNFIILPGDIINVTSRPQEFYYIAGRINFPGQKNFQPGITVLQAILAAGGTADGAKSVELSREGEGGLLTTTKINLKEIKSGKAQDLKLQPGDRIEVVN
jgi:protein involved in polysaccharide export with SLBB domain/Flp pilus assembly protein TadD